MNVINFNSPVSVLGVGTAVGKEEFEGPLGACFDIHSHDNRFGQKTWEKGEAEMVRFAYYNALKSGKLSKNDISAVFAGDLMNQCTASAYGLLESGAPYLGLYGACATMAEGMLLASACISSGAFDKAAVCASSHNCTAERQFRYPVEYGGQRTPTSQRTVTASSCMILGKGCSAIAVVDAMAGRVIDAGINDISNMGAAMAPAAYDTLMRYFNATNTAPQDFDRIFTGDLGYEGYGILRELMMLDGCDISRVYNDCGLMIYDRVKQDAHAGASGCGCGGAVLCGHVIPMMKKGIYKNVLFVGTGAMMSPLTVFQGETIPCIAHLVRLSYNGDEAYKTEEI